MKTLDIVTNGLPGLTPVNITLIKEKEESHTKWIEICNTCKGSGMACPTDFKCLACNGTGYPNKIF